MRLFWIIIGIFMIFAGLVAWARMDPVQQGPTLAVETTPSVPAPPAPVDRRFGEPIELDDADALADDVDGEDMPPTNMIDELSREAREQAAMNDEVLAELDEAQQLADELFDSAIGRKTPSPNDSPPPPTSRDVKQSHEHQPEQLQNPENPWEQAAKKGDEHQPLQHSVNERADGTIVLDETFEIKGQGTAAQPYEVTWDLLLSAAETYQPRIGMTDIPERIQMLDGKYVKISGHLLFPMVGVDAREVLVMLNMWDGCCLGTMPSPYDAIEVQLAAPVRANNRNFMNYGTLEGKLSIDPYLINDWLLGLYVMEDAKLHIGM